MENIRSVAKQILSQRRRMGTSVWEYLWLLANVSADDVEPAVVAHGKPIATRRIAEELGRSRDSVLLNLARLETERYILRWAAVGHAYKYKVFTRF